MTVRIIAWVALAALCFVSTPVLAQSSDVIGQKDAIVKGPVEEKDQGWDPSLSVGATVAFSANSDVVGQPEGSAWTFGLLLRGGANLLSGKHDWRNTLVWNEVVTRTPVVDAWVKTLDELRVDSTYYFRALPNFGPYANASFTTATFKGTDVRSNAVDYVDVADPSNVLKASSDSLKLTDPFSPFLVRESAGAFWTAIDTHAFALETRLGFGASHSFSEGALVITDVAGTDPVEVTTLRDSHQGGLVVGFSFDGAFTDKRVVGEEIVDKDIILYSGFAEMMMPFINDEPDGGRSLTDLTNFETGVKVGFKLVDWASLEYEFKGLRKPDMVDAWQLTHTLLLSLNYSVID